MQFFRHTKRFNFARSQPHFLGFISLGKEIFKSFSKPSRFFHSTFPGFLKLSKFIRNLSFKTCINSRNIEFKSRLKSNWPILSRRTQFNLPFFWRFSNMLYFCKIHGHFFQLIFDGLMLTKDNIPKNIPALHCFHSSQYSLYPQDRYVYLNDMLHALHFYLKEFILDRQFHLNFSPLVFWTSEYQSSNHRKQP